ncbi:hypothetical protein GQ57_18370 [Burkholderia sp. MSh2]|nr:hypothetical protein GQ57_18370 [Burkholderia sp. MSh2]
MPRRDRQFAGPDRRRVDASRLDTPDGGGGCYHAILPAGAHGTQSRRASSSPLSDDTHTFEA